MEFLQRKKTCYISFSRKGTNHCPHFVLDYGITKRPMMHATNKEIESKEDIICVAQTYFPRWKIKEYFRYKKQVSNSKGLCSQCTELLYQSIRGISSFDLNKFRNKYAQEFYHKNSKSY